MSSDAPFCYGAMLYMREAKRLPYGWFFTIIVMYCIKSRLRFRIYT